MAKVGNEAKLILRLAKEQMTHNTVLSKEGNSREWLAGYKAAIYQYDFALEHIVGQLEEGKL